MQGTGVPAQAVLSTQQEYAPQEIKNSEMTEFQPPTLTVSIHTLTHARIHAHIQPFQRRALQGTTLGDLKD